MLLVCMNCLLKFAWLRLKLLTGSLIESNDSQTNFLFLYHKTYIWNLDNLVFTFSMSDTVYKISLNVV